MPAEALTHLAETEKTFPAAEVERRLRRELEEVASDTAVVRAGWEPVLDSLVVVGVLIVLQDLFDFPLAPDKLVRPGGYSGVDDALVDISERAEKLWQRNQKWRSKS